MRQNRSRPSASRPFALVIAVVAAVVAGVLAPVPAGAVIPLPCFPATAGDASATITFEDCMPDAGTVTTQYSDGVHGVQLGSPVDLGFAFPNDGTKGDARCVGMSAPVKVVSVPDGYRMHSPSSVLSAGPIGCAAGEFSVNAVLLRCATVCLSVSGYLGSGTDIGQMSFEVKGYDASGTLLSTSTVSQDFLSPGGAQVPFSVTGGGLQWVLIKVEGSSPLWVDDLSYANDPSAQPAYSLTKDAFVPELVVSPSTSRSESLHLSRSNGSTGTVTFTATGLPPGVTATFSPPSYDGSATGATVVTFTAGSGAAPSAAVDVTLSGDPGGVPAVGTGTGVTQSVSVAQTASFPLGPPRGWTAACTPQVRSVRVASLPGFTGSMSFAATLVDDATQLPITAPGWEVTTSPATAAFTGGDSHDVALSWDSPGVLPGGGASLWLTASVVGHPEDWNAIHVSLSDAFPVVVSASRTVVPGLGIAGVGLAQTASTVTITGAGYCAGSTATFGNDAASAALVPGAPAPQSSGPDLMRYTATTSTYATTGRLVVHPGPGGYQMARDAGPVTSQTYRNTKAFSFHNFPVNDLVYDDMVRAFGHDQMYDTIDLCWPAGCDVTFRDPLAMIWTAIVRSETVGTSGSGHCYGISVTNLRLLSGALSVTSYPRTTNTVYGLSLSAQLTQEIQAAHLQQFSVEMINEELTQSAQNVIGEAPTLLRLKAALAHGPAVIAIRDGLSDGHVVVAYAMEDLGSSHYLIDVYDNNREYTPAEDTDVSGATHVSAQDVSRISIDASGWAYDMGGGTHWGGSWGNLNSGIMVLPYSFVTQRMHIPSFANLSTLAASLVAFGSTGGTPSPVSVGALPAGASPVAFGARGGAGVVALRGAAPLRLTATANAPYQVAVLAAGGGATATTGAHVGSTDTVRALAGGVSLTTASAKPLVLTSVTRSATLALSTTMSLTTGAGSTTALQVSRGILSASVTSGGVASFTTSSSPVTRGSLPQTTSFRIALGAGDRMIVPVSLLARPGATLRVTVARGGRSRVVTVARRAVAVAVVRPLTVSTTVSHGRGVATARVAIRSVARGTQGLLTVSVYSHGRRIAAKSFSCTACRVGTLATAVRWTARRGSYVVRVTLVLSRAGSMTGQVTRALSRTIVVR
jgi:hypothetical protein